MPDRVKIAILSPGGTKPFRKWPVSHFCELAHKMADLGLDVFFVRDAGEKDILAGMQRSLPARARNLIGLTGIEELASVLRRAKVVVANDSGPMHLANALDVSVVGIFGSGDVVRTRPYLEEKVRVVTSSPMACKRCYNTICNTQICMDDITVERVWKPVQELLGRGEE